MTSYLLDNKKPVLPQLAALGVELDQRMRAAFKLASVSEGTSDAQLFQALYHLNSLVTRNITINEDKLTRSVFQYRKGTRISPDHCTPNYRLFRILQRAMDSSKERPKTLGTNQFLRAVIADNEELGDNYPFRGHIPDMLAESNGHPYSTLLSSMPEVRRLITGLEAEPFETDDFQYILTLDNERVQFRIASVLDDYVQESANGILRPQRACLTHFKGTFGGFTQDEIEELEELLNSGSAREADFQRYLESHTHFFRKWDYREVHPHVYLAHGESHLIPDFILTDRELQRAMILELKKADFRLTRRQPNRDRLTDAVMEARAQLFTYRDWFRESANRRKLSDIVGMEIYEPRLAVVVGRSSDFIDALDRQKLQSTISDVEIVTYDDIRLFANRRRLLVEGE